MLLGVDGDDVRRDYLLTNDQLVPALKPIFDRFAAGGGDLDILLPLLGVRLEYLDAAQDEMRTRYGDIDGYFTDGLRIGLDEQRALRAAFVEPACDSHPTSDGDG